MKKIVKLTESDLKRIVKKVLKEQDLDFDFYDDEEYFDDEDQYDEYDEYGNRIDRTYHDEFYYDIQRGFTPKAEKLNPNRGEGYDDIHNFDSVFDR